MENIFLLRTLDLIEKKSVSSAFNQNQKELSILRFHYF